MGSLLEISVLRFIKSFTSCRTCWFLLFLFAIVIDGCALYFQYGLGMRPCVNCVYERAAIFAFGVCGIVGFLFAGSGFFRSLASAFFLASSIWGLLISFEHYEGTLNNSFGSQCLLAANFPSFLKLDVWLPWMFKPLDTCSKLDWSLLGLSMPQWLVIIFVCGTLVSFLFLISQFVRLRPKRSYRY